MSARLDSYGDDLAGLRNRALLLLVQASGLAPADVAVLDHEEASPRASSIPALHPDGFDGPMGVLVELAERRRIDLGRMSVRDLVEQFTSAMTWLAGRVAIERQADWLVLATRLVLLCWRLLFPASPQEAVTAEQDAALEEPQLSERLRMRARAAGAGGAHREHDGADGGMPGCAARPEQPAGSGTGLPARAGQDVAGRLGAGADAPAAGRGSRGQGARALHAGGGAGGGRAQLGAQERADSTFVACLELPRPGGQG